MVVAFPDTKPHYNILNGLRGVAAIMVVWFHIFETFATSHLDQIINHGYLAVDFFFILSGVVAGSIILTYICFKFYDMPVRKYLTSRFLKSKNGR